MTDPLQLFFEKAAKTPVFPPNSRYHMIPIMTHTAPDGRTIPYVGRRIIPSPERFAMLHEHTVTQGERLDHIAAKYFGDPELFWRLCDANGAIRPEELTETTGRRLRITLPENVPASSTIG